MTTDTGTLVPDRPTTQEGSEFSVADQFRSDKRSPLRWVISHLFHLKGWMVIFLITAVLTEVVNGLIPIYTGEAFDIVAGSGNDRRSQLAEIAQAKMKDLNANDIDAATKIIEGSARAMGLQVVEG